MKIHHIQSTNSVLNNFIAELRDITIQIDSMRFRRNIERIGEILSYEMSKTFDYKAKKVVTPLGKKDSSISEQPVICSILRAGLPLHQGLLNYFDRAENAFISAYRHHPENNAEFEIITEYVATPNLQDKTLILADPMLATGRSLVSVYEILKQYGAPKNIHIASVIAAQEGIDYIAEKFPENTHLWIAAIDEKLTEKGYIVPGLGDAGDLAYGSKLEVK